MNAHRVLAIAALLAGLFPAASMAHHSTAEFDYTKVYQVKGTIKEFQWTNPHAWVQVLVPDAKAGPIQWGFELGSPTINIGMGWKATSVKAGDVVTVVFCPSRALARGTLLKIILPDGKELPGVARMIYKGPDTSDLATIPTAPRPTDQ